MATASWYTEMPMAGTGTAAYACARTAGHASGRRSRVTSPFMNETVTHANADAAAKAVKQDAICVLTDGSVRPTGTPGESTG